MRVKISLTTSTSAVVHRSCAPAPRPSNFLLSHLLVSFVLCVPFRLSMRSVHLLGSGLPALHAPPACRSVETPRPPSFFPLRQAGGRSFSGPPHRFFLAQGVGQACRSPSLRRASTHAHPLKRYCVFFRVFPFGAKPVRRLPCRRRTLRCPASPAPRFYHRTKQPTKKRGSYLRLKKRANKVLCYFSRLYGLP